MAMKLYLPTLRRQKQCYRKGNRDKRYESFKAMYKQIDKKLFDCEELDHRNVRKYIRNLYERTEKEGTVAIGVEVIK